MEVLLFFFLNQPCTPVIRDKIVFKSNLEPGSLTDITQASTFHVLGQLTQAPPGSGGRNARNADRSEDSSFNTPGLMTAFGNELFPLLLLWAR